MQSGSWTEGGREAALGGWRVARDTVLLCVLGVWVQTGCVWREALECDHFGEKEGTLFTCVSGKGHAKNAQPLLKDHHFPKEVAPCHSDLRRPRLSL